MWNETYCIFSRTHEIFLPEPKAAAYQQHVLYHPPTTDQTPLTLFTTRSPAANKLSSLAYAFLPDNKTRIPPFPNNYNKKDFLSKTEISSFFWVSSSSVGQRRSKAKKGSWRERRSNKKWVSKSKFENVTLREWAKVYRHVSRQSFEHCTMVSILACGPNHTRFDSQHSCKKI